jgi:MFS transporter, DHA3 family, macrolide efflux protein
MLVSETHQERANTIQQMAFPLAGVVAQMLTGLIYTWAGLSGVILIDLATFLIAVVAISLSHIPQPQTTAEGLADRGHFGRELLSGFRYLIKRRTLLALVLYLTFINFLLNGPLELAIPYLIQVTGSEAQVGSLMGMMSLGALAGAGLMTIWGGTRPLLYTLLAGLLLTGLMFLHYGTARSPLGLGLSLFLLMISLPMSNTLFISILQVKTPPDMQGRIFATVSQLGFLGPQPRFY